MSDLLKTNEALIKENQELKLVNNALLSLHNKNNFEYSNFFNDPNKHDSRLTSVHQNKMMAWWEMDVKTGNVTYDKLKVDMLGYTPKMFTHYTHFTSLVHPADYDSIMEAMKGHFEGKLKNYEAEYRIRNQQGEYTWFYDFGSIIKRDIDNKPLICRGYVINITERKKQMEVLFLINTAVESTSDAIGISDIFGRHFYQNKALTNLLEFETAEELESAGGGQAIIKDSITGKQMFETIMSGKSWSGELNLIKKNGMVFPAYERADAIKDNFGNIIGLISLITDFTERKKAEEQLNGTNQMLKTVLDNFPGVVFWKDRQSRYLGCNKTFANGAGLNNPSEIVGKTDAEFPTFAKNADKYRTDDFEVMESEKAKLHMIDMRHQSDGKTIWLDTSKFPLLDSQGQIIGVIGISNDITKLKVTEQELIKTNEKLNAQNEEIEKRSEELVIVNRELEFRNDEIEKRSLELTKSKKLLEDTERVAKLGGWEFDVISNKLTWSDMVYSMHEVEPDYEPTAESVMSFYEQESLSKVSKVVKEILTKGTPYDVDLELITAKQNRIWVRSIANAAWKNGKIVKISGMLHDITERKQSEIALYNSKQELRNFAAHLQFVREEDKIAISREIHDDLGQILVALKIDLGLYKMREIKGDVNVTVKLAKLDQVTELVDRTIKTTRRIMTGLRPEIIDSMGFINASKAYLLEFEERHNINCHFNSKISELKTNPAQSLTLFRILQESLTNVVKHAKATEVTIQLYTCKNKLIIEIKDNGVGIDKNHKVKQDSYGMIGMKERVRFIDGSLIISGDLGEGTTVSVEIPYEN